MTTTAKSFILSETDLDRGVFRKIRAKAKEENVTIAQYLAGMLRHALKGHDLSKIHFYQDGSGQTYNLDVLDEIQQESDADFAAGRGYRCETKEQVHALLVKLKEVALAGNME
ncbi:MAG: hypothetical protein LBJ94_01160 [Puniceicoccales bacterium]|jgi:hypothetical protein|nr:hypothetical protein [Puniceicoccales bacterium]